MPTIYLDLDNGVNGADGLSFANRMLLPASGLAAVGSGEIRVMASYDPTSIGQCTWTNDSKTVTIPSGLTLPIYLDGAWTASANVTATASSAAFRQGANSSSLAVAVGFTTGKVAFVTVAPGGIQDYSAFNQITLWLRTNLAISSGVFDVRLCSDVNGNTPVDTLPLPAVALTNTWQAITVDKKAALGSSIRTVAVYANSDPGTVTLLLDNIAACKAPGSGTITLNTPISKNTGNEFWHPIDELNNVTVTLGAGPNTNAGSTIPTYYGTTQTVDTFVQQAYTKTNNTVSLFNATSLMQITISGGWNRSNMSTQNSMTWIEGSNDTVFTNTNPSNPQVTRISNFGILHGSQPTNAANAPVFVGSNNTWEFQGDKFHFSGCTSVIPAWNHIFASGTIKFYTCGSSLSLPNATPTFTGNNNNIYMSRSDSTSNRVPLAGTFNSITVHDGNAILMAANSSAVITTLNTVMRGAYNLGLGNISSVSYVGPINITTWNAEITNTTSYLMQSGGLVCIDSLNLTPSSSASNCFGHTASQRTKIKTLTITESVTASFNIFNLINGDIDIDKLDFGTSSNVVLISRNSATGPTHVTVGRAVGVVTGTSRIISTTVFGQHSLIRINSFEATGFSDPSITSSQLSQTYVYKGRYLDADNDYKIFGPGYTAQGNTILVHGDAVMAHQVNPTNTIISQYNPIVVSLFPVVFEGNKQITVTGWFRRTNTAITAKLICRGNQIPGVTSDVSAIMSVGADTWEQLSISFTPTCKGTVLIEAQVYGGTTYTCYISDFSVSQAA